MINIYTASLIQVFTVSRILGSDAVSLYQTLKPCIKRNYFMSVEFGHQENKNMYDKDCDKLAQAFAKILVALIVLWASVMVVSIKFFNQSC